MTRTATAQPTLIGTTLADFTVHSSKLGGTDVGSMQVASTTICLVTSLTDTATQRTYVSTYWDGTRMLMVPFTATLVSNVVYMKVELPFFSAMANSVSCTDINVGYPQETSSRALALSDGGTAL
eukprot:gene35679-43997_t